jgi:hypothetical protein
MLSAFQDYIMKRMIHQVALIIASNTGSGGVNVWATRASIISPSATSLLGFRGNLNVKSFGSPIPDIL